MKKILKLTFILFLVCAVTAGILGVVNELTKDRIEQINIENTNKAYQSPCIRKLYGSGLLQRCSSQR